MYLLTASWVDTPQVPTVVKILPPQTFRRNMLLHSSNTNFSEESSLIFFRWGLVPNL